MIRCEACGGQGWYQIAGFEDRNRPIPCPDCGMSGRVPAGSYDETNEGQAA